MSICPHGINTKIRACKRCEAIEQRDGKEVATQGEVDFYRIDKNRLDEEWTLHPDHYHDYAVRLADAREDLDRAKLAKEVAEDDLEQVEAGLDLDIRRNPLAHGLEKITEAAVGNVVKIHPKRRKSQSKVFDAQQTIIEALHAVGVLDAAVKALEHKKTGLEKMVQLMLSDYYAVPRAPKGTSEEVKRMERDNAFGGKKRG